MRVLQADSGREMRGGQWQVYYLIRGLAEAGCDCMLLAPRASPLYRLADQQGWRVQPLSLARLWRLARESDIVHAHTGRAHTLAVAVGAPRLVVARRVAFPVKRSAPSRWKYARAARFIAVSEYVKQNLLEAGVPAPRITVIHDGVPLLEPANGDRIVAPATDDPRKGTSLVRQAAEAAGVTVHFSSNLNADLAHAAVFVYITEEEGLGSAVLLAMSAGVSIVASRVGGLCEVVEHGVTGLLTENHPEAIASAIRTLLDNPRRRAELGRRGRERVQERFSVGSMVQATLAVYREVLSC